MCAFVVKQERSTDSVDSKQKEKKKRMRKEERRRKLTIETRNLNKRTRTRTIQYYISHTQHIYRIYHA